MPAYLLPPDTDTDTAIRKAVEVGSLYGAVIEMRRGPAPEWAGYRYCLCGCWGEIVGDVCPHAERHPALDPAPRVGIGARHLLCAIGDIPTDGVLLRGDPMASAAQEIAEAEAAVAAASAALATVYARHGVKPSSIEAAIADLDRDGTVSVLERQTWGAWLASWWR